MCELRHTSAVVQKIQGNASAKYLFVAAMDGKGPSQAGSGC